MTTAGWILIGYLVCLPGLPLCQPQGTGNPFVVLYPTKSECVNAGLQLSLKSDLPDQTTAIPTCVETKIQMPPEPKPDAKDAGEKLDI